MSTSALPYYESCGMMKRVKDSVNGSAGIQNSTKHSPRKRSRHRTRSAYFSGTQSNLKRSKENPSIPPSSSERSVYFVSSPDSCAGSAWSFDWGSAFTERAVDAFRACPKFTPLGVRHLCERRCYLRAYEPCRKWHALRCTVVRAGAPTQILNGWSVRMDRAEEHRHPWRIFYVSPEGDILPSRKAALEALGLSRCSNSSSPPGLSRERSTRRERRRSHLIKCAVESGRPQLLGPTYLLKEVPTGAFPPSPFGLIEELLYDDPWKMLLGCIMLNQTTRSQMDPVLSRFLNRFPTAATVTAASIEEVTRIVAPLGLHNRRPIAIIRFSQEYLQKAWNDPKELYWIGKYASDAYNIFVKRNWRDVQPDDHALNWWVDWKRGTETQDN